MCHESDLNPTPDGSRRTQTEYGIQEILENINHMTQKINGTHMYHMSHMNNSNREKTQNHGKHIES